MWERGQKIRRGRGGENRVREGGKRGSELVSENDKNGEREGAASQGVVCLRLVQVSMGFRMFKHWNVITHGAYGQCLHQHHLKCTYSRVCVC